jgi:hypothetical protein
MIRLVLTRPDPYVNVASCTGRPIGWWDLDDQPTAGNERARQICSTCPLKLQCELVATEQGMTGVIRGGVDFPEVELAPGLAHCGWCDQPFLSRTGNGEPKATCSEECRKPYRAEMQARSHSRHHRPPISAVA